MQRKVLMLFFLLAASAALPTLCEEVADRNNDEFDDRADRPVFYDRNFPIGSVKVETPLPDTDEDVELKDSPVPSPRLVVIARPPTNQPTTAPTKAPTQAPSRRPTATSTRTPSKRPTATSTRTPSKKPPTYTRKPTSTAKPSPTRKPMETPPQRL